VTSTSPRATNRRAAIRAGSIKARHCSPPTRRAASDGQIDASLARESSNWSIARSSGSSLESPRERRQASEQYFTLSQLRAHFARHCIVRPQRAQLFEGRSATQPPDGAAQRQDVDVVVGANHCSRRIERVEMLRSGGPRNIGPQ
jgi:hypothetical protein